LDVFYPVDKDPQVLKPLLNSWLPNKSEPIRCGFLEPAEIKNSDTTVSFCTGGP
jgi:hypothetical protein